VGDQDSDMVYATQAQCMPIAYLGGVHEKEKLAAAGAKVFIENFSQLSSLEIF